MPIWLHDTKLVSSENLASMTPSIKHTQLHSYIQTIVPVVTEGVVAERETVTTVAKGKAPKPLERTKLLALGITVDLRPESDGQHIRLYSMIPMQHASLHPASSQLTFAGLDALAPCMVKICVAGIPARLEPSTTASTTATFTGFLGSTALWTYGIKHC